MKKVYFLMMLLSLSAFYSAAHAAIYQLNTVSIKYMSKYVNSSNANLNSRVFVSFELLGKNWSPANGPCSSDTAVLPLTATGETDKELYSMLLTAQLAAREVHVMVDDTQLLSGTADMCTITYVAIN